MVTQPVEETRVSDQSVFSDLGEPRPDLTRRQGRQHIGVGNHTPRLIKSADHILTETVINACLTANRRVDLREECRWDLHKVDAAQIRCRRKAGNVTDNSPTKSDKRGVAVIFIAEQKVVNSVYGCKRFMP